jgi:phospholipid transport system substrate-binding protein
METIRSAVLLLLSLAAFSAQGAQSAPDALLKNATSEVLASLKEDKGIAGDAARLDGLIESKIVPVFDFSLMTQFAMGRNWRQASTAQRGRLTTEFKSMLVRTYSGMLTTYRDAAITYKPIRFVPGDTDATVRSEVSQPGAKPLRVDYEIARTARGWKVYDVKIDGISVVTAYRDGFAAKVRESGVDGLIRSLSEKNRQSVSTTTALAGG